MCDPYPAWTPFEQAQYDPNSQIVKALGQDIIDAMHTGSIVAMNSRYQVTIDKILSPMMGYLYMLSIKDRQKTARHDWRDFQRIKNELIGPEYEAVELYPAESRLVDSANQYFLFVFTVAGKRFPFGFRERLVAEGNHCGAIQREWEADQRPEDCVELTPQLLKQKLSLNRKQEKEWRAHDPRRSIIALHPTGEENCRSERSLSNT